MTTVDLLQRSLKDFEAPAQGPQPRDIYEAQYWEMSGAHAFLMRGLLSVYQQATIVSEQNEPDFIGYALQWVVALEHHHDWEENVYYPLFNPKFETKDIVAEHATFTEAIHTLEHYLTSCLPEGAKWGYGSVVGPHDRQPYDGEHLRSLVDAFVEPLTTHFMQEITYLEPSKIRASGLSEAEVKHIAAVSKKHMKELPPFTFLVYTVLHSPRTSGFPPIPGLLKHILVPWVFALPYRRYWRFAPKD